MNTNISKITLYTIVFLSAIFIGADCAINAAYYLGNMSFLGQFAVGILIAALSGFVLNFLLYTLDAPDELETFFSGIKNALCGTASKNGDEKDLAQTSAPQNIGLTVFCYTVALGSAAAMGLFTYDTYMRFQLSLGSFSQPIVIVMCLAYAFLTFTLIQSALRKAFLPSLPSSAGSENQTYARTFLTRFWYGVVKGRAITQYTTDSNQENAVSKESGQPSTWLAVGRVALFVMLAGMGIFATVYTALAWFNGTQHALMLWGAGGHTALALAIVFSALILIGEVVFTLKACNWATLKLSGLLISGKNADALDQKSSWTNKLLVACFVMLFGAFVVFNAVGNAAIACSSAVGICCWLAAVFGGVLSIMVMSGALDDATEGRFSFEALLQKFKKTFKAGNDVIVRAIVITAGTMVMLLLSQLHAWHQMMWLTSMPMALPLCYVIISLCITLALLWPTTSDPSGNEKVDPESSMVVGSDGLGKRGDATLINHGEKPDAPPPSPSTSRALPHRLAQTSRLSEHDDAIVPNASGERVCG